MIYEEGSPQEIFSQPKKERTRQFIYRLKVQNICIDSQEFDFYGCNAAIASFCQKNEIAPRLQHCLMLLFEEICIQILLPRLKKPRIKWTAEYAAAEEQVTVWLAYNGLPFDIRESDNKLSLRIIQGIADILKHEQIEGEELANRLLLRVKK